MKIGMLLSSASREGGGVSQSIANLCRSLVERKEIELVVFALRDEYSELDRGVWEGIALELFSVKGSRKFGFAPELLQSLLGSNLDVLHLHGMWMYPSIAAAAWSKRTKRPLVISTHGMMDPWLLAKNPVRKFFAKVLYERKNWSTAAVFHALNQQEALQILACVPKAKIVVAPNPLPVSEWGLNAKSGLVTQHEILYLGRLHPKKNVIALVQAWAQASKESDLRNWKLVVAGWGHADYLAALTVALRQAATENCVIDLVGPVFGEQKENLFTRAKFLILPSFGEGMPMAVAEAWARGIPTIMSHECNLSEGFTQGCAIRTDTGVTDICQALMLATNVSDADWARMSRAAVSLSRAMFDPATLAGRWIGYYSQLLS